MARYIEFAVADKTVTAKTDGSRMVGGTREHYYARATFDAEWDGLDVRVTWTNGGMSATQDWEDGMEVPPRLVLPGRLRASFVGVGADGVETLRTARMAVPVDFEADGDDLCGDGLGEMEDIVHAAKRRLDDLSQAVDDAQETVADAERAVSECDDATAAAKSATEAARTAKTDADGAAKSARRAAENAATQAMAAESMAAKADRSAQDAETRSTEAADYARRQADLAVSEARGELAVMLGDPTDEGMWLYATGQADGVSGTPALDNAADDEMMGYVRGEV